jgi:AAA ATPase domain
MGWQARSFEAHGLCARAVSYQYRFCPRCRREWPAKHRSCPECVHWLGDQPLERTEWQVVPRKIGTVAPHSYELIGASALILRVVSAHPPTDEQLTQFAELIREFVTVANAAACEVAGHGWLVWNVDGLRATFRMGCEIERRLTAALPRLESVLRHCGSIRWGVWIDQYIVPFDEQNGPAVGEAAARAIFDFEPANLGLSSEAVYQTNRRWEHFMGAPRRLLNGQEPWGYRMIGHKRPSALDHAEAKDVSSFVGRERQLSNIEDCWTRVGRTIKLAVTASAGSGKTRLIKEWLRRHPEVRALAANFSLFGGAIENFASQLAELPPDRLECKALVAAVMERICREKIEVLVLDDLHWADSNGLEFIQALLAALPPRGMLVVLAARPSGREQRRALKPDTELKLTSLPAPAVENLARRLAASEAVAAAAALRSKGNPLFVEQFAAWAAEANFHGGQSGPHTLHQVIAARIEHLSKVRIADVRQRLRWGGSWERQALDNELRQLEAEVGLWLDRLETGDYADHVETVRHLSRLERLDYEIFLTSMLMGRPRPRSSRLREAIERLLIGCADQMLADVKRRKAHATDATKEEISREAQRAADILFAAFNWTLARDFYELVYSSAPLEKNEIGRQLMQCRRHSQEAIRNDSEVYSASAGICLDEKPSVDTVDLPYAWADLGRVNPCGRYFAHAAEAAEAINDRALAAWAKRKAAQLRASKEPHPRS